MTKVFLGTRLGDSISKGQITYFEDEAYVVQQAVEQFLEREGSQGERGKSS